MDLDEAKRRRDGSRDGGGGRRKSRSPSLRRRRRSGSGSRRNSRSSRDRPPAASGAAGEPSEPGKKKKKKRSGRKRKRRDRKRGGLDRLSREDMLNENEKMLKRLQSKAKPRTSESEKNQSLARLAGLDPDSVQAPLKFSSKAGKDQARGGSGARKKSQRKNRRIDGSDDSEDDRSGSEDDDDSASHSGSGGSRSRSRSPQRSRSRSRSSVRRGRSRSRSKSPSNKRRTDKKWTHDKFRSASPVSEHERQNAHRDGFGDHWQKIRSERSKERERNRSRSSSRSSRSSSRSSYTSYSRSRSGSSSFRRSSSSSSSGSVHRERRAMRKEARRKRNDPVTQAATLAAKALKQQEPAQPPPPPLPADAPAAAAEANDKVNMGVSGKLLEDTNVVDGVVVKYSEPAEARKPKTKWRLYVFKGNEELPILYIHRQSAYLLGRDRKVADIPLDHPSCSKQHAALQYRLVDYTRADGSEGRRVTPYVIDLGSANGTFVNNQKIESQKYVQLLEKDVLKFGFSSREYVMLHDQSKEQEEEDPGVE